MYKFMQTDHTVIRFYRINNCSYLKLVYNLFVCNCEDASGSVLVCS